LLTFSPFFSCVFSFPLASVFLSRHCVTQKLKVAKVDEKSVNTFMTFQNNVKILLYFYSKLKEFVAKMFFFIEFV